jgi:transposase
MLLLVKRSSPASSTYMLPRNVCGDVIDYREGKAEDRRKGKELTKPITLPPLDEEALKELHWRYEKSPDAETRTRYQMLLLALQGQKSSQIARTVLRSQDTVERVLNRFLGGGLDAVPRRTAPGRARTITAAWEAELLRVIELDPHEVGQDTANWTTERLAQYLGQQTGIVVTEETVRLYLHAHDYVCKRPTWTLRRKAEQKADYVGNACG